MSGHSDVTTCPNCGKGANECSDYKPFSYTSIECLNCGLTIYPKIGYMDLEELNERREEQGMKLLKKLPKQDPDVW